MEEDLTERNKLLFGFLTVFLGGIAIGVILARLRFGIY